MTRAHTDAAGPLRKRGARNVVGFDLDRTSGIGQTCSWQAERESDPATAYARLR